MPSLCRWKRGSGGLGGQEGNIIFTKRISKGVSRTRVGREECQAVAVSVKLEVGNSHLVGRNSVFDAIRTLAREKK